MNLISDLDRMDLREKRRILHQGRRPGKVIRALLKGRGV